VAVPVAAAPLAGQRGSPLLHLGAALDGVVLRRRAGAHGCTQALTQIASTTGHEYALGALAHAIGETSLLEGDAETAAEQLSRAVEIFRGLDIPFERAHVELRAGVALAAAGQTETALERLRDAHLTARKLGRWPPRRPVRSRRWRPRSRAGSATAPRPSPNAAG
jgi:hypothetical protein